MRPPARSHSLEFDLLLLTVVASTGLGIGCFWRSLEFDLLLLTVVASTGLGIGCIWLSSANTKPGRSVNITVNIPTMVVYLIATTSSITIYIYLNIIAWIQQASAARLGRPCAASVALSYLSAIFSSAIRAVFVSL